MKNLKLIVKLLGGFILVALIVVVAVLGVTGSSRIAVQLDSIGKEQLPASTSILNIKADMKEIESAENCLFVKGITDTPMERHVHILREQPRAASRFSSLRQIKGSR